MLAARAGPGGKPDDETPGARAEAAAAAAARKAADACGEEAAAVADAVRAGAWTAPGAVGAKAGTPGAEADADGDAVWACARTGFKPPSRLMQLEAARLKIAFSAGGRSRSRKTGRGRKAKGYRGAAKGVGW